MGEIGEGIQAAQLFANVLALPRTIQMQQQQAEQERTLLSQYPGLTPQQVNAYSPNPPLGRPGSLSGKILNNPIANTIGSLGQVLQAFVGTLPAAPRPPLTALAQLGAAKRRHELGERIRADIAAKKSPQDMAGDIFELDPKAGVSLINKSMGGTGGNNFVGIAIQEAAGQGLQRGTPEFSSYVTKRVGEMRQTAGMNAPHGTFFERDPAGYERQKRLDEDVRIDEAERKAKVRDQYKTLPTAAQVTLSSIDTVDGLANDMEKMLAEPEVQANIGVFSGRLAQRLYQLGWAQEGEDPYVALRAQLQIIGASPYIRSTRNFQYIQQIQEHLPKPGDQLPLIQDKIHRIRRLNTLVHDSTLKYATATKGELTGKKPTTGETPVETAAPAEGGSQPVEVQTPDEAHQLAPGTKYRTPDGRVFQR